MIHEPIYVIELIRKYYSDTATSREQGQLAAACLLYTEDEMLEMTIAAMQELDAGADEATTQELLPLVRKVIQGAEQRQRKKRISRYRSLATAACISALLAGIYHYLPESSSQWFAGLITKSDPCDPNRQTPDTIPAAHNKALIRLSNGDTLTYNHTTGQVLTREDGAVIRTNEKGDLVYEPTDQHGAGPVAYNKIFTSLGQQCRVRLSDGSLVWLNAGSSIEFPVVFPRDERTVKVSGEVAFEVESSATAPFNVIAASAEINVHGTRFNVNAYHDTIVTTLETGSLEVMNAEGLKATLKPGEQAKIPRNAKELPLAFNKRIPVTQADLKKTEAWKKGFLFLANSPIAQVVADLGRMYNLEMVNMNLLPHMRCGCSLYVCRNMPIPEVLRLLRSWGLVFEQEGNKIIFREPRKNKVPVLIPPSVKQPASVSLEEETQ